ncbi:right-handed parallel beta-helix repeat-containing protein [bacterium]|nr:right-handed parallel beta-helix repeat-containing protein [bacterium]
MVRRIVVYRLIPAALIFLSVNTLFGDTFAVVNTLDSGDGSLRQALTDANAHQGEDEIVFHIPISDAGYDNVNGVWTIRPQTALPQITDHGLVIDGRTQAVFIGSDTNPEGPEIELDGTLVQTVNGLHIHANIVQVYDLVINRFTESAGIVLENVGDCRISGCYIGTDAMGGEARPNLTGISIYDHCSNVNVIPDEDRFNIVSGNTSEGISIADSSCHNVVQGNYIGLNRMGDAVLGNGTDNGYGGVFISDASDSNIVEQNRIGGNRHAGVYVMYAGANTITGNYIGVNEDWSVDLGNTSMGVWIRSDSYGFLETVANVISGNQIGYNGWYGIIVEYESSYGNLITENGISRNGDIGIFLNNGSNAGIAAPEILSADMSGITGTAGSSQIIEIFCDEAHQGKMYLGRTLSDATGQFTWIPDSPPPLPFVTATARDKNHNTSGFSYNTLWTGVDEAREIRPDGFRLDPNFPNPFNSETVIRYTLRSRTHVRLLIYDITGKIVTTLADMDQSGGTYSVHWNGADSRNVTLTSGLYFCILKTNGMSRMRKLVIQR